MQLQDPGASGMAEVVNPTLRRKQVAAALRELRERAHKSTEQAAVVLECSIAKISRIETGVTPIRSRDVRDLCAFYGATDSERERLLAIAAESRQAGWWTQYKTIEDARANYIGLEAAAAAVFQYEAVLIPGLLQTRDYTTNLLEAFLVSGDYDQQWVNELAATRLERQKRLASGELAMTAVLDEAAVRRQIGSPAVMREQIDHLIALTDMANVSIQVVPFDNGSYPAIGRPFQILHFPANRWPDVLFLEDFMQLRTFEKPDDVEPYRAAFRQLTDFVANDGAKTIVLLKKLQRSRSR
jgi:transcriptional regulator with XRE-family HTH domain